MALKYLSEGSRLGQDIFFFGNIRKFHNEGKTKDTGRVENVIYNVRSPLGERERENSNLIFLIPYSFTSIGEGLLPNYVQ